MPKLLAATAIAIAIATILPMAAQTATAADFPDMQGVWTGSYTVVSPSRVDQPGPRYNSADWVLEITDQNDNLFFGTSKWRVVGRDDWNEIEATGTLNVRDPSAVSIVERSPEGGGIEGLIDGTLDDGKLYVTFKGVESGTSFSTVLERKSGN